jgi:dienelactone hydrolase
MIKKFKKTAIVLIIFLIIVLIAFLIYTMNYEKADELALDAMASSNIITETDEYIEYEAPGSTTGLIFYPGGKVEEAAYSRLFIQLAEEGITTWVVKMPFHLAVFNVTGAQSVIDNYPEIENWYFSGHSLGGVMVTEYCLENREVTSGIIYLASYSSSDISNTDINVLSLKGSLDGLVTEDDFEASKDLLPEDAVFYIIEGGNHSQFGDYGLQENDVEATITPEEQQGFTVEKIMEFINSY